MYLGVTFIIESMKNEPAKKLCVTVPALFLVGVATSIDALAIGITYAFLDVKNYIFSFILIGAITFVISLLGVKIGNTFGTKYGNKAELGGGLILIFIGTKILIEHTIL